MRMTWDPVNSLQLITDTSLTQKAFQIATPKSLRYFFVNASLETRFGGSTLQDNVKDVDKLGAGYVQITGSVNYKYLSIFLGDKNIDNNGEFMKIVDPRTNLKVGPGLVSTMYPWEASSFYWKVYTCPQYTIKADGTYERIDGERETIDDMVQNGHDLRYVTNFCLASSSSPDRDIPGDDYYGKMALNLFVDRLFEL